MSKLDTYLEKKRQCEAVIEILKDETLDCEVKAIGIAHDKYRIAWAFTHKDVSPKVYVTDPNVVFFIGQACNAMKDDILREAAHIAEVSVKATYIEALQEAEEFLRGSQSMAPAPWTEVHKEGSHQGQAWTNEGLISILNETDLKTTVSDIVALSLIKEMMRRFEAIVAKQQLQA